MKLTLATFAVALLAVPAAALAGEVVPPPCNPHHETCGPPNPHGGPTCENGGTVVWINQWHFVCVPPPDDECKYDRGYLKGARR